MEIPTIKSDLEVLLDCLTPGPDSDTAWMALVDLLQEKGDPAWEWVKWARESERWPLDIAYGEGAYAWYTNPRPKSVHLSDAEDIPATIPVIKSDMHRGWSVEYPHVRAAWKDFLEAASRVPYPLGIEYGPEVEHKV